MSDLRPCPFCGSRYINMNYIREDGVLEGAYVECANCGVSTRIYDDPDEVVEFWNSPIIVYDNDFCSYGERREP